MVSETDTEKYRRYLIRHKTTPK